MLWSYESGQVLQGSSYTSKKREKEKEKKMYMIVTALVRQFKLDYQFAYLYARCEKVV